ncbi:hypothetical protein HPB48_025994 [Haemaphysalis longicornis]|uniref:Uncharacterized protein n=1 Tax=Haemaphysalis longicornis TaxID=44386 RepID=A0A9J6H8H8_HAELO|nr:hypothetical protein HPB48_025994 [Haemaphysalis longicornis]
MRGLNDTAIEAYLRPMVEAAHLLGAGHRSCSDGAHGRPAVQNHARQLFDTARGAPQHQQAVQQDAPQRTQETGAEDRLGSVLQLAADGQVASDEPVMTGCRRSSCIASRTSWRPRTR